MYIITIYNDGLPTIIHSDFAHVANCKITVEKNSIPSMTFTIYPDNPGYDAVHEFSTYAECVDSSTGEMIFEGRVLSAPAQMDSDGMTYLSVTCEGPAAYLCDSIQPYTEERTWKGDTGRSGLQEFIDYLLSNHNARMPDSKRIYRGIVDLPTFKTTENVTKSTNFERTWDLISDKLVKVFGGEVQVKRGDDGKLYLDYREHLGSTSKVRIAVGRNMATAKRELKPDQLITRLYPRGCKLKKTEKDENGAEREVESEERLDISSVNAGKTYVDDTDGIKLYGLIEGENSWDDVTDPAHLKDKAERWLAGNNELPVSTTITGYDLSLLGVEPERIRALNWYPCYNPLVGLDENLEVVKQVIDVSEPAESTWDFGETAARQSSKLAGIGKVADQVEIIRSESKTNTVNIKNLVVYTKSAIEVAKDSITSTVGKEIVEIDGNVSSIGSKVDGFGDRLDNFGGAGVTIEQRVSKIVQTADGITAEVKRLKSGQESMQSTIAEMPDSIKLEVRQGYTEYVAGELRPVNESISSLELRADGLTSSVTQLESGFGTCSTVGYDSAKSVKIQGFTNLHKGATVCVKFTYANSADSPTLDVSGTGAKPIRLNGVNIAKDFWWAAGDTISFVYDGIGWAISDAGAKSKIKQLANSISLEVSGSLGSTASIIMSVDGSKMQKGIDLSGVRNAFANDSSAITINAGRVTFNSGTFVVNSSYFNVANDGSITSTKGEIGGFTISRYSISNDKMSLGSNGLMLRYETDQSTKDVGLIGAAGLVGEKSKAGLNFNLEASGDYMTFAARESASSSAYTMRLTYAKTAFKNYAANRVHLGCDMDLHGYSLKNAWIDPDSGGCSKGITGTFKTHQVIAVNSDGTISRWSSNPSFMTFKNGLLVEMTRYDF